MYLESIYEFFLIFGADTGAVDKSIHHMGTSWVTSYNEQLCRSDCHQTIHHLMMEAVVI